LIKIILGYETRDKTAHFATLSPFGFVAQRMATFSLSSSRVPSARSLTSEEVLFCADLLYEARTYFENQS
jgi:hypothetical protein